MMKLLRYAAAWVRGGTPGFDVLEMELLRHAELQLDSARAGKLRQRIESVNLVQRLDGGREVNSYCIKNGKPKSDESLRLVDENEERKLATFSFRGSDRGPDQRRFEGTIWLVHGQLFSIEFNHATEHVLEFPPQDVELSICI